MKPAAIASLVRQNAARSKKSFFMSGIGIVVGVATFVFFIGLGQGIKQVVLGKIFIANQIEITRRTFDTGLTQTDSFLGLGGTRALDDQVASELATLPGVDGVFPKMKFTFPSRGWGGKKFLGKDMWFELIADGVDPSLVAAELPDAGAFADPDAPQACTGAAECGPGRTCEGGACVGQACTYVDDEAAAGCPGDTYCAEDTGRCERPIPAIVSHHLLELYNGSLATAFTSTSRKLPRLSQGAILGFQVNVTFGKSFLGASQNAKPITRRLRLVGFSDKAIALGATIPLGVVKRLNARFAGEEAARTYQSMLLQVNDQGQVPRIAKQVKDAGFDLADKTERAEQAGMLINIITLVFSLISVIIVGIAAVNISHTFYMIVFQRKREIGVMRAVGASRGDVRAIILSEALVIGLLAGVTGAALGFGAAQAADLLGGRLPDFPYKPDTFFLFPVWLWPTAVGFAALFCVFGAFFPANAAARLEPAEALTN
ncbi:ABC transporter permease [Myxococcota bacterium]|nr:ABC transporter permease [Myxococcota bacterium]